MRDAIRRHLRAYGLAGLAGLACLVCLALGWLLVRSHHQAAQQAVTACGALTTGVVDRPSEEAVVDETCLANAFATCRPATLVINAMGVDTFDRTTLTVRRHRGVCTVDEQVSGSVLGRDTGKRSFSCSDAVTVAVDVVVHCASGDEYLPAMYTWSDAPGCRTSLTPADQSLWRPTPEGAVAAYIASASGSGLPAEGWSWDGINQGLRNGPTFLHSHGEGDPQPGGYDGDWGFVVDSVTRCTAPRPSSG